MDKSNSKGGLVVGILIGIIIMLGVGACLFVTNTISFSSKTDSNDLESANVTEQNNSERQDNTRKIVGEYTYSKEYSNDGVVYNLTLDLMEDNTFYIYESATQASYSYGTYNISGNSIIFNFQFTMANSQDSFNKIDKTISSTVNSSGNIIIKTDSDSPLGAVNEEIIAVLPGFCVKNFTQALTFGYMLPFAK